MQQRQDDGFHEIQLNGKQLVFLFMAATVVSVVIFLCGVLVGRGVRVERTASAQEAASLAAAEPTPQAAAAPATPAGSDPTAAAPPPANEDLSYFNRLEKEKAPSEHLKPTPAKPAATTSADRPSTADLRPEPPKPEPAKVKEPPAPATGGDTWTVQIAALNVRGEAEAIAKRMTSKGYPAYVVSPTDGTSVYRVRVGRFTTRREAESLKTRLEKEEQLAPWVTR